MLAEMWKVTVEVDWTGEKHSLNLGPLVNGTYQLEFVFSGVDGNTLELQTTQIAVEKSSSQVQKHGDDAGVDWVVERIGTYHMPPFSTTYALIARMPTIGQGFRRSRKP
jgi:hypothetical protein